jgi:hypothetical protein
MKLNNAALLNLFGMRKKTFTCPSLKPIHKNRQEDVSLLVIPLNLTVYLMNFLKMVTLNCHMLCHHLKN